MFIGTLIRTVREKPRAVRNLIALTTSLSVTAVIALVWLSTTVSRGMVDERQPLFATLVEGIKNEWDARMGSGVREIDTERGAVTPLEQAVADSVAAVAASVGTTTSPSQGEEGKKRDEPRVVQIMTVRQGAASSTESSRTKVLPE